MAKPSSQSSGSRIKTWQNTTGTLEGFIKKKFLGQIKLKILRDGLAISGYIYIFYYCEKLDLLERDGKSYHHATNSCEICFCSGEGKVCRKKCQKVKQQLNFFF